MRSHYRASSVSTCTLYHTNTNPCAVCLLNEPQNYVQQKVCIVRASYTLNLLNLDTSLSRSGRHAGGGVVVDDSSCDMRHASLCARSEISYQFTAKPTANDSTALYMNDRICVYRRSCWRHMAEFYRYNVIRMWPQ